MNKRDAYLDLIERQQKELSEFPIGYAFNGAQLRETIERLGGRKEEYTTMGYGTVIKKTDIPAFNDMTKRHYGELYEALKDEEFAEAAFLYEMNNHEYAINWSRDEDVFACFNLDEKKLKEMGLEDAYNRARKKHMDRAREWDLL